MDFVDAVFYFKDGTERGCQQNAGGRSAMWIQDSFVDIDNADIQFGDYGLSIRNSAGEISNSVISVTCTGVGIQGKRTVSSNSFSFDVLNNEITTVEGGPIVVTSQGLTNIISNEISGSSQGSGIVVVASQAEIHNNEIGPIGGWNGKHQENSKKLSQDTYVYHMYFQDFEGWKREKRGYIYLIR